MNAVIWSGLIIAASAGCAIAYPLSTYALTLATFGIAHVAIELRYIDSRFHRRFGDSPRATLRERIELQLLILVLAIACLRGAIIFDLIPTAVAYLLELGCGLALIIIATHRLWIYSWWRGSIGLAIGCLLGVGIIYDPIATSAIFAIVHNLTPIGFIIERQGVKIKQNLWWCGAIFGMIPIAIFLIRWQSGWQFPIETNVSYLRSFIAPAWQQLSIAYPLFATAAFLQCMHYAAVIGLLSRWTQPQNRSGLTWLSAKYFYLLLGGISIAFFIAFQHSFAATRAYYGIVASIHAWIEIPLLLLLLLPHQQESQTIGTEIGTAR